MDEWLSAGSLSQYSTQCQLRTQVNRLLRGSVASLKIPEMRTIALLLSTEPESASAVACFLCRQLMAASGQRVGLSQQQLQRGLHHKCNSLPHELAEHCNTFVETFLQEIYFSLNYDFSARNVCVALNICDKDLEISVETTAEREKKEREREQEKEREIAKKIEEEKKKMEERERLKKEQQKKKGKITNMELPNKEEKRLNCIFCERMLDNAKQYAETAKSDIESFASTACSRWPRRRFSDDCNRMAEEKINQLAKFVDEQVVEALWCSELYNCG